MEIPFWRSFLFFVMIACLSVKLYPSQRQMGFYYAESSLLDKARFYLEQQFHRDPEDMANTKRYMESLNHYREYRLFEQVGKRMLEKDPENPLIHELMARFYEGQMLYDEAGHHWKVLYGQNPADGEVRDKLVSYYLFSKNFKELIDIYAFETGQGTADLETYYDLGQLYVLTRQVEEAEKVFRSILEKDSGQSEAKMRLAELSEFSGDSEQALIYYRDLADQYPEDLEHALRLADRLVRYRDRTAEAVLGTLVERFPDNEAFLMLMADYYMNAGQRQKAVETLEELYGRNGDDLEVIRRLGEAYFELKQYRKTREMMERYHEATGGDYHTHHVLGDAYAALGERDAGKREYEAALRFIRDKK